MTEGWARPLNSRKHHYFRKRQSVCGKWMLFNDNLEPDTFASPDDCVACRRALDKEKEQTNEQ
jgi:hypothetical protein